MTKKSENAIFKIEKRIDHKNKEKKEEQMRKLTGMVVIISAMLFLFSCAALQPKQTEKAVEVKQQQVEKVVVLVKGEIDYIKPVEISSLDGTEMIITMVGFKSGEGVILSGIYPGLREGKKVKIHFGQRTKDYKGSAVYEATKIEPIVE